MNISSPRSALDEEPKRCRPGPRQWQGVGGFRGQWADGVTGSPALDASGFDMVATLRCRE